MLFLFTIFLLFVVVSAALLLKRGRTRTLPESTDNFLPAAGYRPLFEPDEAEMRAAERLERARADTLREEELKAKQAKKREAFLHVLNFWSETPDRQKTVEMLYLASQTGDGSLYTEAATAVLEEWHRENIPGLSANDLAQMLESHFWLLPADERTPGITFRLKDDIADLRRAGSDTTKRSAKVE